MSTYDELKIEEMREHKKLCSMLNAEQLIQLGKYDMSCYNTRMESLS